METVFTVFNFGEPPFVEELDVPHGLRHHGAEGVRRDARDMRREDDIRQ